MSRVDVAALTAVLLAIETHEKDYDVREGLVYDALAIAKRLHYACGIRVDAGETDPWPVVCIQLPEVGEVSWHCPPYRTPWSGYDTDEKYKRVGAYAAKHKT